MYISVRFLNFRVFFQFVNSNQDYREFRGLLIFIIDRLIKG